MKSEIFGPDLHYVTYPNSKYNLEGWTKYSGKEWPGRLTLTVVRNCDEFTDDCLNMCYNSSGVCWPTERVSCRRKEHSITKVFSLELKNYEESKRIHQDFNQRPVHWSPFEEWH